VHVRYGREDLERLAVDAGYRSTSWGADVVRAYRRRHQSLVAAVDCEDLRALRCLDLQSTDGHDGARASVRLLNGARLLLEFDPKKSNEVTVMGIIESDTWEVAP
jgi:proteic killer suppression protein